MALVRFTGHLRRFFPKLESLEVEASTVREAIAAIDRHHRGLASYLVDDQGALRKHVNIFVDGSMIDDRLTLADSVRSGTDVFVTQALSGGC